MTYKDKYIPLGYKDSPLGIIPKEWEVKRLGDICDFLDSQRIPIKDSERGKMKGKYPYYGASGIIDYVNDYIFDDDLILLGEDGANIIMRSTPLAFLVSGKVWINNHAHVLKAKKDFNRYYICNYLESLSYDKYNTGTAQPKLNREVCEKIPVLIPNKDEQSKIANLLITWDTAIEKQSELIEKLTLRKRALMQQLLTGKKRLPGFNGEWKRIKLGNITERVTRKNEDDNKNVVTISAQRGFVVQTDFFNKSVASDTLDNYFLVHKDEFCYNKSYSNGYPMGAIKRLNTFDKAVVTTLYICFRLKDKTSTNIDFFEQYCESGIFNKELVKVANEGGRAHGLLNVTPSDFFSMHMSIPTIDEQNAIASVLVNADKEIELANEKLTNLQSQKRGLMQQLLTGGKRVV
jgi:type I restriction enzyme S subunit